MAAIDILVNYITKGDEKQLAALADFAKAMGYVGVAVGATKAIYEATVAPTIEYAKQIENLNTVTQTGAAETSKLIQVADDARVEFGTLQVASKNLVKNGIQPTIANIADLSDEYLSMQDPVLRTQFLMDTFGSKAGPEMEKLLKLGSDALYEMADGAEAVGLVMDEQALQATKDYQASLDSLGDAVEGVKIRLGTTFIPWLNNAIDGTMSYIGGLQLLGGAVADLVNPFDDASDAVGNFSNIETGAIGIVNTYISTTKLANDATMEAAKAAEDVSGVMSEQYYYAIEQVNGANEDYIQAQIDAKRETEAMFASINTGLDSLIEKWLQDLEWMQSGGLELQSQFEAIKKAFVENPEDPDIKAQMEDLYAKTIALKVIMGEIDGDAAAKEISETIGVSISEAWALLNNFKIELAKGSEFIIDVIYQGGSGPTMNEPPGGGGGGTTPIANAFGGATFAGDDYWVGERGPEPFSPAVPGTITPTQTVINNYNLSMQTAQSMGNLSRDFGVMKAFARA